MKSRLETRSIKVGNVQIGGQNKVIIQSMTKEEREDPSIMRNSHKRRIAMGSGTSINDVNKLINQYDRMKKMMKQMSSLTKGGFGGLFG